MAERSLVTGGAGFIGSHVAAELVRLGHHVYVIDDLSGGFVENVPTGARLEQVSVLDHERIARLFDAAKFDYVFHLAAYAAEGLSHFIRRFNYTNNVVGSMSLIDAAVNHGVKCFVFTSSIAVYGEGQLPMSEELTPRPEDPYGIAKLAVEQDLAAAKRMFGLDYVIFRPHNVYGEHQNIGDPYRNVVGIFMNQVMQGKPMTVFGDGEQQRAFTHVSEVAPVIARAPTVPDALGEVFNIGADTPYTVNELAGTVAMAMGGAAGLVHLPARNEVYKAYASHDKIRVVFGGQRAIPLSEGIQRMADWAKRTGPRRGKPFEGVEIEKGLPPSWARA